MSILKLSNFGWVGVPLHFRKPPEIIRRPLPAARGSASEKRLQAAIATSVSGRVRKYCQRAAGGSIHHPLRLCMLFSGRLGFGVSKNGSGWFWLLPFDVPESNVRHWQPGVWGRRHRAAALYSIIPYHGFVVRFPRLILIKPCKTGSTILSVQLSIIPFS